jgi:serine phosphatase RsbU (regulator of sigma subunit)
MGPNRERFGADRLIDVLESAHGEGPTALCERLIGALDGFQVGAQADDTAAVVMRRTGGVSSIASARMALRRHRLTAAKAG